MTAPAARLTRRVGVSMRITTHSATSRDQSGLAIVFGLESGLPSLTLTPGTRLGPYEILSTLGAGGMGEVYRARDGKLNRDVSALGAGEMGEVYRARDAKPNRDVAIKVLL